MRLPQVEEFSARAYLRGLGVVIAPDVELERLSIGGRGASGNMPSHLEVVLDASEPPRRVAVDTWGEVLLPEWITAQNLVASAVAGRTLAFRSSSGSSERSSPSRSTAEHGRSPVCTGGDLVSVRATIDGAHVSVEGHADLLEDLRLRRLGERELRELLP